MSSACRKAGAAIFAAGVTLSLVTISPLTASAQRGPSQAAPASVEASGRCAAFVSKYVAATGGISTASITSVNVPNTRIKFTQGGTRPGCVIVSFSAEASADANTAMLVQALLDDTVQCQPHGIYFVRSNATATDLAARAMNYVCPDVAPGKHAVRMRYSSNLGGNVYMDYRMIIVQYVP